MSQELTDLINNGPDPSYSSLGSPRRFYLAKRHVADDENEDLAETWRAKQEAEPGTPLPDDFPHLTVLSEDGYETVEDLDGAGTKELQDRGFSLQDAEQIVAAFAAL